MIFRLDIDPQPDSGEEAAEMPKGWIRPHFVEDISIIDGHSPSKARRRCPIDVVLVAMINGSRFAFALALAFDTPPRATGASIHILSSTDTCSTEYDKIDQGQRCREPGFHGSSPSELRTWQF